MSTNLTAGQILKSDPEIEAILAACSQSTKAVAKVFFPNRFRRPFDKPHEQIFDLIDSPVQKKLIMAPRSIGKTSCVGYAFPARRILFRQKRNIIYVSKSNTHATQQSENLKTALLANPLITKLFGPIKSKIETDEFSKEAWVANGYTKVTPLGAKQQVRGLLFGDYRPDLFIIDDLEDDEEVLNETLRDKLEDWFYTALMNTVDLASDDFEIAVIGTLLHEASLLAKLMRDPTFKHLIIPLADQAYESNFPNYLPTEKVKKMLQEARDRGKPDHFAREMMCQIISTDTAAFRRSYFQYYSETDPEFTKKRIETVILIDPAKSVSSNSAYSAVWAIGIDLELGRIYCRELTMEKLYPDQLYKLVGDQMERWKSHVVGLEITGICEFIRQPFLNYLQQRGLAYEFIELKPRGGLQGSGKGKEERVGSLISYYRNRQVYHNSNGTCAPLEAQLLSYPRSEYWDAMDCLAYIVEMLELGGRYFNPVEPTAEELENEYAALNSEDDLEPIGAWRLA